jgi:hypothetical protein
LRGDGGAIRQALGQAQATIVALRKELATAKAATAKPDALQPEAPK